MTKTRNKLNKKNKSAANTDKYNFFEKFIVLLPALWMFRKLLNNKKNL